MCISFFALYNREESVWEVAVYNGVKDILFSCGFSWLIFVCVTGQGGLLDKFLSHQIFKPLSRLSFCGYLTQTIVLEGYFLSVEVFVEESILYQGMLSDLSWVLLFTRLFLWTLISGFVVSLLFESPVIRLLYTYFPSK
ncbi:hypothetical protein AVEN_58072-1 [Araneus ventricosus]|uniref:Uncharacterized protein n=1 Tax=Araneus ventricosus TaxID=182803 RepID=A0A4Y2S2S2_ARAVE|nr:hypothetical protein AVEN_58072-1 [Araneus ventricosus]